MDYSIRICEIGDNTLQFLLDWAAIGVKANAYGFDKMFLMLLDEKLKRNEIS